jgi:hypothetical protein
MYSNYAYNTIMFDFEKRTMKKILVFVLVWLSVLLCGCVNEKVAQGGVVLRGASPTEPPYSQIQLPDNEDIVYLTPTGEKYHTADCPSLRDTAIPVTLEQAQLDGIEPCSKCH